MRLYRLLFVFILSCNIQFFNAQVAAESANKKQIIKILDDLNTYAANADFQEYFELFADESNFIGTDATENWQKKEFMIWAKPFFDKKKTWNFKSIQRNITILKGGKIAYFDELLDTQMKICRGSGVLEKIKGKWKIKQYVLSMTIPNEVTNKVVEEKKNIESEFLQKLKINKN